MLSNMMWLFQEGEEHFDYHVKWNDDAYDY